MEWFLFSQSIYRPRQLVNETRLGTLDTGTEAYPFGFYFSDGKIAKADMLFDVENHIKQLGGSIQPAVA